LLFLNQLFFRFVLIILLFYIMKKLLSLALLLPLTGCVQMLSPAVMPVGPNTYLLQTQGNAFASASSMQAKLYKKANEVCKGKGFENLSEKSGVNTGDVYTGSGVVRDVSVSTTLLEIKCND
jgi:hypothetical protein